MKKFLSAIIGLTISLQLLSPVFGQTSGITTSSATIGGSTANIVTIDMSNSSRILDVALSEGSIHKDSQVSNLINQGNLTTVAAINGGFFNSYYSGTPSYPSNYPVVYGTVVKNGNLISGLGESNLIGMTSSGEILIDRVNLQTDVRFNNNKFKAGVWAIGSYNTDSNAVSILTSEFPYKVTTSSGSKVFTIRDDKISAVSESGSYTVPNGTSLLIYNSGVVSNVMQWDNLPKVGDTVEIYTYAKSAINSTDLDKWNSIQTAVAGGRMLVQNGTNVAKSDTYNGSYNSDPKQSATSPAQRSFVAKMSDGTLVLGTVNSSFVAIADYLVSKGAVSAVSLDGGASSMLYTKDKGFITSAGRKLATSLIVVDGGSLVPEKEVSTTTDTSTTTTTTPVVSSNKQPSPWAVDTINKAIGNNLVPEYLQYDYKNNITRQEFSVLIVKLIEQKTGKTIDEFRLDNGILYANAFLDSDDYFVRSCASLGIVAGSNNMFRPNDTITREEAAVVLQNTLFVLNIAQNGNPKVFKDTDKISSWATNSVSYVTALGIMNGVGEDFNPKGNITREQVYITMQNIYNYK